MIEHKIICDFCRSEFSSSQGKWIDMALATSDRNGATVFRESHLAEDADWHICTACSRGLWNMELFSHND